MEPYNVSLHRSLIASAAALPALAVPAIAENGFPDNPVSRDPVFAAIDAHKPAFKQWLAASRAVDCLPGEEPPEHKRLKRIERILSNREWRAEDELFSTVPTTLAGLQALFAYLRTDENLSELWRGHNERNVELASLVERAACRMQGLPEPPAWEEEVLVIPH
jgi:hypothetical protein